MNEEIYDFVERFFCKCNVVVVGYLLQNQNITSLAWEIGGGEGGLVGLASKLYLFEQLMIHYQDLKISPIV